MMPERRALMVILVLTLLLTAGVASGPAHSQPPNVEPSPELERLHFQLGTWRVTTEKLDQSGGVVDTRHDRMEVELEHGGLMIRILHYPEGSEEPAWRIWQFHDRYDGKLHDVSFDVAGHFEHRVEVGGDGALAFAFPEPRAFQDGVPRNWRKTYSRIEDDSFQVSWHYTEDEETWIPIFEATHERVGEARRESPATTELRDGPLADLEPWVGSWVSRLDPKYRDHPMIRRFNPDLKSQELRLSPGITGETLDLEIWHLDRPADGLITPASEGKVLSNPADGSIRLVEYGVEQDIFHRGHYEVQPEGDLHRTYEAFFPDGASRRFREIWHWKNPEKTEFEWITQHREGDAWVSGEIVVDWVRQTREPSLSREVEALTVDTAFDAVKWLIGDWQAQFRPRGDDQPAPTMTFEWGDDHRSSLRMTGTQPTPDGRLVPEHESMVVWHPVRRKLVFLGVYRSRAGRVVEDGDVDLLEDGGVRLNMRVHYPAGITLPFSAGAEAGPEGHTLEFRRTFHRKGPSGLRGVFRIKRGGVWENPHPELKMDDGYPWRRVE